ncbi:hypothetical protein E4T45_11520 [Aureobasidium sp. EXF-8846]|nr:hypothetical protein E4T45_11520 [Aureobasidium sp. EXF-8846]
MASLRLRVLKEKIQLKGDEDEHEQVDPRSNPTLETYLGLVPLLQILNTRFSEHLEFADSQYFSV